VKKIILIIIRYYQLYLSPFFPDTCRFYPGCSEYCIEAIERFGIIRGLWMASKRILRCHPFSRGGYDPVPRG